MSGGCVVVVNAANTPSRIFATGIALIASRAHPGTMACTMAVTRAVNVLRNDVLPSAAVDAPSAVVCAASAARRASSAASRAVWSTVDPEGVSPPEVGDAVRASRR